MTIFMGRIKPDGTEEKITVPPVTPRNDKAVTTPAVHDLDTQPLTDAALARMKCVPRIKTWRRTQSTLDGKGQQVSWGRRGRQAAGRPPAGSPLATGQRPRPGGCGFQALQPRRHCRVPLLLLGHRRL